MAGSLPQPKFTDPLTTTDGSRRAWVSLHGLQTLWFNTGTLCNLACANCYIESTPRNDALVYLSLPDVTTYLEEIKKDDLPVTDIGITGGEPFMNPAIILILQTCLQRGYRVLVLTNAMRPMMKKADALLNLNQAFGEQLTMRVSVDHYSQPLHEEERGARSWQPMLNGLKWLSDNGFALDVAGRTRWDDDEQQLRKGYAAFFAQHAIRVNADDRKQLMLFPEMDEQAAVPEITTACWDIVGSKPADMMCASSRMVVRRKDDDAPSVQACTLLAYDQRFNLGHTLREARQAVPLNHPHCARFCVLGGGACKA